MTGCYKAAWIVPVDAPPIANAAVFVRDGRIAALGEAGTHACVDLGDVALLPGLVNAHTHLELTDYHGKIAPAPFWEWLEQLVVLRATASPEAERTGVHHGAQLSLASGTTLVGDISRPHGAWPILKPLPLRKVCFAELISFARRPARTPDELADLVDGTDADDRLVAGVSPHAPYTVYPEHLRATFDLARQRGVPITMHLAETREEIEYCREGTGPIRELLDHFGRRDRIPPPGVAPLDYLRRLGGFDVPLLLAHVNYIDDDELAVLADSPCSVAYCPRAHRYFGHAPHPFRRMLDAGINVAIGTDSAASLPVDDGFAPLSVLDEIRFLHREHPDMAPEALVRMATINGARALGLADRAGSITPGKWADLVAVPLDRNGPANPQTNLLESHRPPVSVAINGSRVDSPHEPRR